MEQTAKKRSLRKIKSELRKKIVYVKEQTKQAEKDLVECRQRGAERRKLIEEKEVKKFAKLQEI